MRRPALILALAFSATLPGQSAARVWEGTVSLPSYDEGPPDVNPPFDALSAPGRPNYPYTMRDQLTDSRRVKRWRAVFLENEYLKCSVLPDLGGHLYGCTDKINGQEMFYANTAIKLSNIAYRGSWAAFGIEFNFPVSHNWMTTSPVDVVTRQDADGGVSVIVGNTDRAYGLRWLVALTLKPGRAALDQRVALTNPGDTRQRFYWWTNAAVRAFDDTQILYPMKYTASHGFADVDTWPVDTRGTDNSVLRNHRYGPVSRFSHGSREGYMAIWQPATNAGVAHFALPDELPAKKIWSWGVDADALDWRRALSDDSSAYVEIQAGLFRDQETYAWIDPHERIEFTETWLPLRELGGVTRVTPRAALHMGRDSKDPSKTRVAINVTEELRGATVVVRTSAGTESRTMDLSPRVTLVQTVAASAGTMTVSVLDAQDGVVISHADGEFDYTPDSLVVRGRQPSTVARPSTGATDGAWLSWGAEREVNGDLLGALGAYRMGLSADPKSIPLLKAAGRLAVSMSREAEGAAWLGTYLHAVPADHEAAYYRGLARLDAGDVRGARMDFEFARQYGPLRYAAERAIAGRDAVGQQMRLAADRLERVSTMNPELLLDAAIVARAVGRRTASTLLAGALRRDPASVVARWEHRRQGAAEPGLMEHLAADPHRILLVAERYLEYALHAEAAAVLEAEYPPPVGFPEAGLVAPSLHPLVAYYIRHVREKLGMPVEAGKDRTTELPSAGVFPHGRMTRRILLDAARARPDDHLARHLLGMMDMQRGDVHVALARWDSVRAAGVVFPSLYRNLAAAHLLRGDTTRAAVMYEEGTRREATNPGVWLGADSVMLLRGTPATERAMLLDRYPDKVGMPTALVYRYARALAEAGRFEDADALFRDRWFSRVEGGTNPRGVWTDVRSLRALVQARAGQCRAAQATVRSLGAFVPRLTFTRDGMSPFLAREPVRGRIAAVTRACP